MARQFRNRINSPAIKATREFYESAAAVDFSDMDDLDSAPVAAEEIVVPAPEGHVETCVKCRGTGRFVSYAGRDVGQCFTCKGTGKQVFKNSTEVRRVNRTTASARKVAKGVSNIEAFEAAHPAAWAWIVAGSNEFHASLVKGITKYGSLTDNQMAAVERRLDEAAERLANPAPAAALT